MTATAPPAPSQTQPPAGGPAPSDDTGRIALIAVALTTGATIGAMVHTLLPQFYGSGIDGYGLTVGLRLVMHEPWPGRSGPATDVMWRAEPAYRAAYVLNVARRVTQAASNPPDGVSRSEALGKAVAAEQRYFQQHRTATMRRYEKALDVDRAASRVGSQQPAAGRILLGWYSRHDERTTPECRAADGGVFYADQPPVIGYPGLVHPQCRCFPGPPKPGGRMVDELAAFGGADRPHPSHRFKGSATRPAGH